MFWKKQREFKPEDIAVGTFDALVRTPHVEPPAGLKLNSAVAANFAAKAGVYQLAAVMQLFTTEGRQSTRLAAAKTAFDKMVFGLPIPNEGQQQLSAAAQEALDDLRSLMLEQGAGGAMQWGMRWLQAIGVDHPSPIHAMLLSTAWMDFITTSTTSMRRFA